MLYSLGGVDGLLVADMFAGTGALGIEALSRGAASVSFVEMEPVALDTIRGNLTSVGLGDAERSGDATVIRADAEQWAASTASRFDLVLCDPPYGYDRWEHLVGVLPCDLAVLESRVEVEPAPGWGVIRMKRYGSTIVTVTRPELVTERGAS